jgi:dTDP-glucose pyrophosphorylase
MESLSEIEHLIINLNTPLREVLLKLNSLVSPMLLVVGSEGEIRGTITDGDVRRALLAGEDIGSTAQQVMHLNPAVASIDSSPLERRLIMNACQVYLLPIVDGQGKVVGMEKRIHPFGDVPLDCIAVVMCGGLGIRMGEYALHCPKPMLEVGGKPILERIIDNFADVGIPYVYLAINHLGHVIEQHFGDGRRFNINIDYLRESVPCGTGGALGLLPKRPSVPMIVMNGDILTQFNVRRMVEFHNKSHNIAVMGMAEYHHQNPYGVVRYDGNRLLGIIEKPITVTHINAGIYVISPDVLDFVSEKEERVDMPDILLRVLEAGLEVGVYPICEYWMDIGRKDDYLKASSDCVTGFFHSDKIS